MPGVSDDGQRSFHDQPLHDAELYDACVDYIDNQDAARSFARADRTIKAKLPAVDEATRFLIGEHFAIEVTPQKRDGYKVEPNTSQRKRVKQLGES